MIGLLTEERHRFIRQALDKMSIIQLQEISEQLNVSESTIRRDFAALEEKGVLIRVHGGAKKVKQQTHEASLPEKRHVHVLEKQLIGKKAGQLVEEGDVIYLDSGTTTFEMIPWLNNKKLLVVTNGIEIASALYQANIKTLFIGGFIKQSTGTAIGASSYEQMLSLHFDKAFLGINGIDLKAGFTMPDIEEGKLKKAAIQQSKQAYFLADSSKFDTANFYQVAELKEVPLMTDKSNKKYEKIMQIMEVSV